MQRNPFAKPFEISKKIIETVVIPGATILDPYAGEGSLVRAALRLGMKAIAVEKSKKHFPGLVEHVKKIYSDMARGKAEFIGWEEKDEKPV